MTEEKINPTIVTEEAKKTLASSIKDPMTYEPGMDQLPSTMLEDVERLMKEFEEQTYSASDVKAALRKDVLSPHDFGALLSPAARPYLEAMAQKAKAVRDRYFGNSVALFTPLYLANYCENYCIYCGFNCHNKIHRARLDLAQMEEEMKAIAATGLEEILMLTGESSHMSPVSYIGEACKMARRYFRVVGLEIYPVNQKDYEYLHQCGCDFVTVFQETYDHDLYGKLHLAGNKRVFPYRFYTRNGPFRRHARRWSRRAPGSFRLSPRRLCYRPSWLPPSAQVSPCGNRLFLPSPAPHQGQYDHLPHGRRRSGTPPDLLCLPSLDAEFGPHGLNA